MKLWWLSFAGEEGFLGVCILEAPTFLFAVFKTHLLAINPGGEVKGFEIPEKHHDDVIPEMMDRLLSKSDLLALFPDGLVHTDGREVSADEPTTH